MPQTRRSTRRKSADRAEDYALDDQGNPDGLVRRADKLHNAYLTPPGIQRQADGIADDKRRGHQEDDRPAMLIARSARNKVTTRAKSSQPFTLCTPSKAANLDGQRRQTLRCEAWTFRASGSGLPCRPAESIPGCWRLKSAHSLSLSRRADPPSAVQLSDVVRDQVSLRFSNVTAPGKPPTGTPYLSRREVVRAQSREDERPQHAQRKSDGRNRRERHQAVAHDARECLFYKKLDIPKIHSIDTCPCFRRGPLFRPQAE